MKKKIFISLLICMCFLGLNAQSQSVKIEVTDDVYVFGDVGGKDVSKGSDDILSCYYNDGASSRHMVFLNFNLSTLSSLEISKIKSIKLKMYATVQEGGGNSTPETHTVKLFNMSAVNPFFSWTEGSLNYNIWMGNGYYNTDSDTNSGSSDAYYFRRNPDITTSANYGNPAYCIATLADVSAGEKWLEWDITSTILNNSGDNISLQLCDEKNVRLPGGNTRSCVLFHSKENVSDNAPYLEVTFKGDVRELAVSADTYIDKGASSPLGSSTELKSYYVDGDGDGRRMTFLKFDLDIPYNSSLIESASLRMYGTADAGGGNSTPETSTPETHTLDVFNMTAFANGRDGYDGDLQWDESLFDFTQWTGSVYFARRNPDVLNNGYGDPKFRIGRLENVTAGEKWFEWDVTDAIAQNLGSTLSLQVCDKYQVKLPETGGNSYVTFHSKEDESGNAPQIQFGMKQSDLLLSTIKIDDVALAGFDSYVTDYSQIIPSNSSVVPIVSCTSVNSEVEVNIQQAAAIDGKAVIIVTKGNEELRYEITFVPEGASVTFIMVDGNPLVLTSENLAGKSDVILTGNVTVEAIALLNAAPLTSINMEQTTSIATELAPSNSNCLLYVNGTATLTQGNVIKDRVAELISLTDGNTFYCPEVFTAKSIAYSRTYITPGWASLCLPFAVKNISDLQLDGVSIEAFTGIREETIVLFSPAAALEANTPYIAQISGSLTKTFSLSDDTGIHIPQTEMKSKQFEDYVFKGTYSNITRANVAGLYLLMDNGQGFGIATADAYIVPFRAYIEYVGSGATKALSVSHEGVTDMSQQTISDELIAYSSNSCLAIISSKPQIIEIYSIDGILIAKKNLIEGNNVFTDIRAGIYLVGNKKAVVR